jgi:hypothetical protein
VRGRGILRSSDAGSRIAPVLFNCFSYVEHRRFIA